MRIFKMTAITAICAFMAFFHMAMEPAGAADISIIAEGGGKILVNGEIKDGDAAKLKNIFAQFPDKWDGGPTVELNCRGANYREGIKMGQAIFAKGSATLVPNGGLCAGACAYAFLAGNSPGATGGWAPARMLEAGAALAFDSLSIQAGNRQNRDLPDLDIFAYLASLKINLASALSLLDNPHSGIIHANTPRILECFGVDLYGVKKAAPNLSNQALINIAKKMVKSDNSQDWDFDQAKAVNLDRDMFCKETLMGVADIYDADKYPRVRELIRHTLENGKNQDGILAMLSALGTIPAYIPGPGSRIVKISGLNNAHHYKSRIAYFMLENEGSDNFSFRYWLCMPYDIAQNPACESGSLKKYGDVMYDLYPPDEPLWHTFLPDPGDAEIS